MWYKASVLWFTPYITLMFKQSPLFLIIICISFSATAQTTKVYKDLVFSDVVIDRDQNYSTNPSDKNKAHLFDLYQPKDDPSKARPLIIWMHGGGFRFGSKNAQGIGLWSNDFAKRGYVCAGINYFLGKKATSFNMDNLQKNLYYAVADAKMAVAYFKRHYKEYRIDTNKIILAGNSAGGMIALQAAYSNDEELAKAAHITDVATNQQRLKVAAVVNFWGSIIDLNWLKNAHVPIVNVVGDKDSVMPPTSKNGPLYGGIDIHHRADKLHIPNELKVFEGYSHELQKHFNPIFPVGKNTQGRWLEASRFAADFLYKVLFR
jgi:dienelactone hydrolase